MILILLAIIGLMLVQPAYAEPIRVTTSNPSYVRTFETHENDTDIYADFVWIGNYTWNATLHERYSLKGNYRFDLVVCGPELNELNITYDGGPISIPKGKIREDLISAGWCEDTNGTGFIIINQGAKSLLEKTAQVQYAGNVSEVYVHLGGGTQTTVVTSTDPGVGAGRQFGKTHLVYDNRVERWYMGVIVSDGDFVIYSAPDSDKTTWTYGINVSANANAFDYDDFDMHMDQRNSTHSYIHTTYTTGSADFLVYKRCEPSAITPFITCGAGETAFDASAQGGEATDDVLSPSITQDNATCVLIAFMFEDDSEVTADEFEVFLIKEEDGGNRCGDGDWDGAADTETGFPIESVQTSAGFQNSGGPVIRAYREINCVEGDCNNAHAQLFWLDADSGNSADIESVFFNGTSNTIGTEVIIDPDIEIASTGFSGGTQVRMNSTGPAFQFIFYGLDDGTQDLDAFRSDAQGDALAGQVDTNIDSPDGNSFSMPVTATVDTRDNRLYVFSVSNADNTDILMSNSTDAVSWPATPTTWQDNVNADILHNLAAWYNNETCDIMVRWQTNTTSPHATMIDWVNTGTCPAGDDGCTYGGSGDWTCDCTADKTFTDDVTIDGSNVVFEGAGTITFDAANLTGLTNKTITDSCTVVWRNGGGTIW